MQLTFFAWLGLMVILVNDGLNKNPHDFASAANHGNIGCVACHYPHQPAGKIPLWESLTEGKRKFVVYQAVDSGPGASSLVCLGCHDGAIADEVPVVSQMGNEKAILNNGIDYPLASHPIGTFYEPQEEKYVPRATVKASGISLPKNRVECVSCHDPHGTTGLPHLLAKSNRRSALCLSCHQL